MRREKKPNLFAHQVAEGYPAASVEPHRLQLLDREILGVPLPMLFPGVKLNTSPTEYFPIKQLQPVRFDGSRWVPFGDLMGK